MTMSGEIESRDYVTHQGVYDVYIFAANYAVVSDPVATSLLCQ
jgi:hypothetical protein